MLPRLFRSDGDIRKYQINTLKIFNDNVTEIVEGQEYQVSFNSAGNELSLQIYLNKNFPKEKPIIKVSPLIIHSWVNADGEVTSAPGLLNYTVHSDLGRVVQAIIREFERTPPPLASEITNISNNVVSPTIPVIDGEQGSPKYASSFPTTVSFSPPTYGHISNFAMVPFPELNTLPVEELEFLSENADRQDEFLDELHPIKEQNKLLDELMQQVEELAESNLSKQEQLENLHEGVEHRIEEVTKLAFENERRHGHFQNLSEQYSPKNIQEQLRLAAKKAEIESEKIAESFLTGDIDVDKFVSQYIKARTLCQTRKTKEEKLSQQLDSLKKAGY